MTTPLPSGSPGLLLPLHVARRDRDRLQRYAEYLDYYDGTRGGPPGTLTPNRRRDRDRILHLNYARAIVDKGAAYLMTSHAPTVTDARGRPLDRLTEALLAVWDDNNLNQLDQETEVDTATLGDGAYKVTWDAATERVVVTTPDVQRLHAWTRPDNTREVTQVCTLLDLDAPDFTATYGLPAAAAGRDTTETTLEAWTATTYELWRGRHRLHRATNPYGRIPIIVYPNVPRPKSVWGISDLDSIREPLSELNRAYTQLSRILELSGNPIAVLENVDDEQNVAVQPGAVWSMPAASRAYVLDLLQSGGIRLHIDYIDAALRALHDLAEIPRIAFGDAERATSGIALQTAMDPLIRRTARKRLARTQALQQRDRLILALLAHHTDLEVPPGVRTTITWAPMFSADPATLVWGNQPPAPLTTDPPAAVPPTAPPITAPTTPGAIQ